MEKEKNIKPVDPKGKAPKEKDKKPNYTWLYLIIASLATIFLFGKNFIDAPSSEIKRSQFAEMYKAGDISYVKTVNGKTANIYLTKEALEKDKYKPKDIKPSVYAKGEESPAFYMKISSDKSLEDFVIQYSKKNEIAPIDIVPEIEENTLLSILFNLSPILLLIAFYVFAMRKMSGGGGGGFPGGQLFSIGKSKAKLSESKDGEESEINFKSVAGLDEAKQEVMEIVDFLKEPKKYTVLGGKIPKGALLIGPPGTGKTLLAKAMAGEAKVPFFSISGSDFVEMFVGVGASRVRDLFKQAREKAPCIIFIDEIDAIGRARGKNVMGGGNDERENTLNQLLVEMDGFGGDTGIIMVAATNRPDVLDNALLRPGRFDRQISIDRPDLKGREQIFDVHLKKIKSSKKITSKKLATMTPGFVGADIANICNEAALIAARHDKKEVEMDDFTAAIDRVIGGLEKKNKIISPEEKKIIAYHEAGHAICGWYLEYAHPLVKVTIVPRGIAALGYAQYLPKEKYLTTKEEILDDICMTMGGRASEKITFGKISTGAYSDLEQSTQKIHSMVVAYGMSEKVGNVNYHKMIENSYQAPYSNDTAKLIDEEVRDISDSQYKRAIALLEGKKDELEKLANLLLEKEVLYKDNLIELFGKRPWDEDEKAEETSEEVVDLPKEEKIEETPSQDESIA